MTDRAVLLDVDGTLVNSNDAHARAWTEALAEAGCIVPFDRIREQIGKGGDKLLPEVSAIQPNSDAGKQISRRRAEILQERYLPHIEPFPGVRSLLERMREDGLHLVVTTSAQEEEARQLLRVAGVEDLIERVVSGDDVENSKPDPDIIAVALKQAGIDARDAFMLGDTPYDVAAASKASVACIALRSGGWSKQALHGAVAIFDDVSDLLEHYADSPLDEHNRPTRVGG